MRQEFYKAISRAFKSNYNYYLSIIGCYSNFLQLWLEFQFYDKMNWKNYGSFWHVDHVKTCLLFNITNENNIRIINHFSNIQTLEKYENIKIGNKYNNEIILNHTTKILWFLYHLKKTNPDLCKFATEPYSNLLENLRQIYVEIKTNIYYLNTKNFVFNYHFKTNQNKSTKVDTEHTKHRTKVYLCLYIYINCFSRFYYPPYGLLWSGVRLFGCLA